MRETRVRTSGRRLALALGASATLSVAVVIGTGRDRLSAAATTSSRAALVKPTAVIDGREIFRFDDFGDWRFWTDTLRLHDAVETLTPNDALKLGLKVDLD